MQITILDHQRGILLRDGRPVEWLPPGRHRRLAWGHALTLELLNLDTGYVAHRPELAALVPDDAARVLEVPAQHAAVLELDGLPAAGLGPGKYLLWRLRREVEAFLYDLRPVRIQVPEKHARYLPAAPVRHLRVKPWMAALVHVDGALAEVMQEGLHTIGAADRVVEVQLMDLRVQERQVVGQEVMTKDQVTLRLNVVAQYLVTDPARAARAVPDLGDAVYTEVQLAARRLVASLTVDELLTRRVEARQSMTDEVAARVAPWGVSIRTVDLKDVVLPGDMKALLNRVIEAEKQAAAQVILRREETAATRSMANTARMLEQNPMLLRLKELEAMKELAGHVGQLTVVTGVPDWAQRALTGLQGE
jgi:regulator of protease activity HflC (stomatin/prohibitin superfamily)